MVASNNMHRGSYSKYIQGPSITGPQALAPALHAGILELQKKLRNSRAADLGPQKPTFK